MAAPLATPFQEEWRLANAALIRALKDLTAEQIALPIRHDWPIWASASHIAGSRVYWLCFVCEEPGAKATPFSDPTSGGWEDDLAHPRTGEEVAGALDSTWRIVERTLRSWTPDTLKRTVRRTRADGVQLHTRQSVLWRLMTHDVFHLSEISLVMGEHGLGAGDPNGPIDIWKDLSRRAP